MKMKTPTKVNTFGFNSIRTETSEVELLKERMAKLLRGEDISGSGEGVSPAHSVKMEINGGFLCHVCHLMDSLSSLGRS
ncbi:hypothetical protein F2Q70_00003729 [Brassica cretica]|uniref:PRONE domain-containing protein n=1 Tax=Brassica cretica TaxID=69181 RepID=A0A8S9IZM9_BRACR|nr:hypothetical protein F2Q70_00003729 [Brassica cretica]KAF3565953.1 hypothetical protein DY000_02015624 [Brassica cretica]